jgi:hypothetical protein
MATAWAAEDAMYWFENRSKIALAQVNERMNQGGWKCE